MYVFCLLIEAFLIARKALYLFNSAEKLILYRIVVIPSNCKLEMFLSFINQNRNSKFGLTDVKYAYIL